MWHKERWTSPKGAHCLVRVRTEDTCSLCYVRETPFRPTCVHERSHVYCTVYQQSSDLPIGLSLHVFWKCLFCLMEMTFLHEFKHLEPECCTCHPRRPNGHIPDNIITQKAWHWCHFLQFVPLCPGNSHCKGELPNCICVILRLNFVQHWEVSEEKVQKRIVYMLQI